MLVSTRTVSNRVPSIYRVKNTFLDLMHAVCSLLQVYGYYATLGQSLVVGDRWAHVAVQSQVLL
jgi:hypothetical protein